MAKFRKRESVDRIYSPDTVGELKRFLKDMSEDLKCDIEDGTLYVYRMREETDEEEKAREDSQVAYRRRQYEALKVEFGSKD